MGINFWHGVDRRYVESGFIQRRLVDGRRALMFDPARLAIIAAGKEPAALCTVTGTSGSTPRKLGASMVVVADGSSHGKAHGTIGGGAVEHRIRAEALAAIASSTPRSITVSLTTELAMCCGGTMTVFIEPVRMSPPCIVLGGGHCGNAIGHAAMAAGFSVQMADPRDELRDDSFRWFDDYESEDLAEMAFGPDAFVVVVTHDHAQDQALVEAVLSRSYRYLALVGSERKARLTRQRALAKGFSEEAVLAMHCPAGLDIGAETPGEIALSIVAQMVQVRRHNRVQQAAQKRA